MNEGNPDGVIRVIFVDDDDLYMHETTGLLNRLDYIKIVGTAGNGFEAMDLIENVAHDVVLLDVTMPDMGGIETVKAALARNPGERIIMLTAFERPDTLRLALAAGAKGFLTKETEFREVGTAIRQVFQGGNALDSKPLSMVMDYFVSANPEAGDRELKAQIEALPGHLRQVVNLIGRAYSNKEIAAETGLSLNTVTTYVKKALNELGVRRGELTMKMIRLSLSETNPSSQTKSDT